MDNITIVKELVTSSSRKINPVRSVMRGTKHVYTNIEKAIHIATLIYEQLATRIINGINYKKVIATC